MTLSTNFILISTLFLATKATFWRGARHSVPLQNVSRAQRNARSPNDRRQNWAEMMYADFARESFKRPNLRRRDMHGFRNFPVSQLNVPAQDGLFPQTFALWKNEATKEIVFALRGTPLTKLTKWANTDPTVRTDGWSDLEISANTFMTSDRARRGLKTLRAIQRQFPEHTINICGHSLGGTTALVILAQDSHNNVIEHETNPPRSAISAVYVYNPFHFYDSLGWPMETFYARAFGDTRCHAAFVCGDVLSAGTKQIAEEAHMPNDRLYITQLSDVVQRSMSWLFAHNIDGTNGAVCLLSPDYTLFGRPNTTNE